MGAELLLLGGKVSAGGAAGSGAVAASSAGAGRCVAGRRRLAPVQPAALQWQHSSRTRTTTDQKPPRQRCAAAELWRGDAEDGKMGFEKEILKAGTGPKPVKGQKVTVHCTGYGKDGDLSKKFWSTKDPGQQPFSFNIGLGSVIKGWDEGVMGMQLGEVARLTCTPDYAYGTGGFPAWGIQPNSVLIFEIEVLSAK
ncbi:unnamed protein product [Triticum turgidum subsp. durum]|uniref:peptidylprolyl isomerase n=1 Tax=Triticum turgidum subsp. durum TaxID=4567 RepID=A0A9R0YST1_TRITD|nr:unnamed protein product [Triticum turgidum subsp. durum]